MELGGHFFLHFCVLGSSFDVFGALGGPGGQNQSNPPLQGLPFGSILGSFLEQKGDMFNVILLMCF